MTVFDFRWSDAEDTFMNLDKNHFRSKAHRPVMVRSKVAKLGSSRADMASSWCVTVAVALLLALALQ